MYSMKRKSNLFIQDQDLFFDELSFPNRESIEERVGGFSGSSIMVTKMNSQHELIQSVSSTFAMKSLKDDADAQYPELSGSLVQKMEMERENHHQYDHFKDEKRIKEKEKKHDDDTNEVHIDNQHEMKESNSNLERSTVLSCCSFGSNTSSKIPILKKMDSQITLVEETFKRRPTSAVRMLPPMNHSKLKTYTTPTEYQVDDKQGKLAERKYSNIRKKKPSNTTDVSATFSNLSMSSDPSSRSTNQRITTTTANTTQFNANASNNSSKNNNQHTTHRNFFLENKIKEKRRIRRKESILVSHDQENNEKFWSEEKDLISKPKTVDRHGIHSLESDNINTQALVEIVKHTNKGLKSESDKNCSENERPVSNPASVYDQQEVELRRAISYLDVMIQHKLKRLQL